MAKIQTYFDTAKLIKKNRICASYSTLFSKINISATD